MPPQYPRQKVAVLSLRLFQAAILIPTSLTWSPLLAQEPPAKKYSPEVVAKAESILKGIGLRRSGKMIQATCTSDVARAITSLNREKRELRLVHQEWKKVADEITAIRQELRRITAQDVELNLQLARVADGDVKSNNRIVALINASRSRATGLIERRGLLKEELAQRRAKLNEAETNYSEKVFAIRQDFSAIRDQVAESLSDEQVGIALRVLNVNFGSPPSLTAGKILAALDKRIAKIEREVFHETIKLEPQRGALYVEVVVGRKSVKMAVDSGASLVTLPARTAAELGIKVPIDAREMKLVLADGRTIPARGVTLPRIRVGGFEAVNVEAAVLDSVAIQAEPLLGMSYLGNFKFEIDKTKKSLKLLKVAAE